MPLSEGDHAKIDAELRRRLAELVATGRDVVLDFSFWSRAMRDDWRALVLGMGVVPETVYLATDRETCLSRVRARSLAHGDDFTLDPAVAAAYVDGFQPPTPEEGPLVVVRVHPEGGSIPATQAPGSAGGSV